MAEKKIMASGKRKTAVARAVIRKGGGKITINNRNYGTLQVFDRLRIEEPMRITNEVTGKTNFDVAIQVRGGGEKSQTEAARLALARAIIKFTNSKKLNDVFLEYDRNMIVADVRRKETYKPGDSKARAKRQSSKR